MNYTTIHFFNILSFVCLEILMLKEFKSLLERYIQAYFIRYEKAKLEDKTAHLISYSKNIGQLNKG